MPPLTVNGVTREVRAVIFDKDGTLVDFGALWGEIAGRRVANVVAGIRDISPKGTPGNQGSGGKDRVEAELLAMTGLGAGGAVDPFGPLATASRAEELILAAGVLYRHLGMPFTAARELCRAAYTDIDEEALVRDCTKPLPGVPAVLHRLRAAGLLLGIASTDSTANILRGSQLLGIDSLIGASIGGEAVARGKPNPDMLALLGEQLGVPVSQMVMVGDGIVDVQMGRNAGVAFTIGVLTGVAGAEQLQPYADLLLPSLADWDLDHLLSSA